MFDLQLDSDHALLRDSARKFAQSKVRPAAAGWDEAERFPAEIIPELAKLGFLGIRIGESWGGSGLGLLAYALVVEEMAREDGSLALTVASHNGLGSGHIARFGTDAQKQRYLPKFASGEWLAAWALTEPGSGSDAVSMQTRAVREGDSWLITGTKMFITQGSVCGACVVLAVTDADAGASGVTAFVVERDTPGFRAGRHLKKLGMRSSDTVELVFDGVRVADSQRIGAVGHGFKDALSILEGGRISIAALALGLGEGALAHAVRYAQERVQFGHAIADFQAVQWMLANSRAELDAARALTWRAAHLADLGKPCGKEASMAKLYASEAATRVCNRAVQIHGGYGYTRDFPVERFLRDAKLCEIGEGTSEVQRMVISRHILNT